MIYYTGARPVTIKCNEDEGKNENPI